MLLSPWIIQFDRLSAGILSRVLCRVCDQESPFPLVPAHFHLEVGTAELHETKQKL